MRKTSKFRSRILWFGAAAVLVFGGTWMFFLKWGAKEHWTLIGELSGKPEIKAVVASPQGYGVIGCTLEPADGELVARMRARRAQIIRATADGLKVVYEGAGWPVAIDAVGKVWFAIGGVLKEAGEGSDYRLLRSTDAARTWEERGPIPAGSITQVLAVSDEEAWIRGAKTLARTTDGGATWKRVSLQGERQLFRERWRRDGGGVAMIGDGIASTRDGGETWHYEPTPSTSVYDLDGQYVLAARDERPLIGRRAEQTEPTWFATLPLNREPLRLTVSGDTFRVLTRRADPSHGAGIKLHRSTNGGASWSQQSLGLRPTVDIAGAEFGLGVDLFRRVYGRLAPDH